MGEAGLLSANPMEHSYAAYLVPTQNSDITGTPSLDWSLLFQKESIVIKPAQL